MKPSFHSIFTVYGLACKTQKIKLIIMEEKYAVYKIDYNTGTRLSLEIVKDFYNEALRWISFQETGNYEIIKIYAV